MPFISRWSNNYSSTLAADVTSAATTISVASAAGLPSMAFPTGGVPPATAILIGPEIMYVTAISGTTLTVQRAQEGSAAQAHATGATVVQIVTRDTLYNNAAPGAQVVTIPTGTGLTYTPDLSYKYHHLTLGGSTALTINAPVAGTMPVQAGDEMRITFQITATALSTQPTWNACYRRFDQGTTTQKQLTLTANTLTGMSFFWRGGAAINTTDSWVRQH